MFNYNNKYLFYVFIIFFFLKEIVRELLIWIRNLMTRFSFIILYDELYFLFKIIFSKLIKFYLFANLKLLSVKFINKIIILYIIIYILYKKCYNIKKEKRKEIRSKLSYLCFLN